MALLLNIETATNICSVALSEDEKLLSLKESSEEKSHASLLTVFIENIFQEEEISAKDLDAVVVSKGPGSYTGLRIGISAAKGLAYGANIKFIAIGTLQAMALAANELPTYNFSNDTWFCPMIDARRMEVYSAFYDINNQEKRQVSADIIDENAYKDILDERPVVFFGNGSDKCKTFIRHKNATFISDFTPSARDMIPIAVNKLKNSHVEDVAYFEPYYLKDFIATKPKKNIYH